MRDLVAAADLLVGAACPGCGAPALAVCPRCAAAVRPDPFEVAGARRARHLVVTASGDNDGALQRIVVDWKERGRFPLTDLLSTHLATSVAALADGDQVVLVPVPTAWAARRRRGDDLVLALARAAAVRLSAVGCEAQVLPALRRVRRTVDQARLGATDRARNLQGAFALQRRSGLRLDVPIVIVDDIVTTGATLAEAARALAVRGWPVLGAAVVAATPGPSRESGL